MTIGERRKCLKRLQRRYLAGSREERGRLLSELEELTDLHRKSLSRLLRAGDLERHPRAGSAGGRMARGWMMRCG